MQTTIINHLHIEKHYSDNATLDVRNRIKIGSKELNSNIKQKDTEKAG